MDTELPKIEKKRNGRTNFQLSGTNALEETSSSSISREDFTKVDHEPIAKFKDSKVDYELDSKESEESTKKQPRKFALWIAGINLKISTRQLRNSFEPYAVLMGATGILMGLFTAFRSLFSNLFQGFFGQLSDKFGRKIFLIGGFLTLVVTTITLIFFPTPLALIIISIIQALAISMVLPVWNATLGDVAPENAKATFIGKITAISAIVDLLLSFSLTITLLLADMNVSIFGYTLNISDRTQYIISFVIAALNFFAAALMVFLLRETRVVKKKATSTSNLFIALRDKSFLKFLLINSIYGLVMALSWPVDSITMITILEMDFWQILLYFNLLATIMSIIYYLGGKASDKIGRRKPLLIVGRLIIPAYCLLSALAILFGKWWILLFDLVISSLGWGLINSSIIAYILDVAPEDMRGAYLGSYNTFWGIFCFIGSLIGGVIIDVLVKKHGFFIMGLSIYIGGLILRMIAGIGFFFIDETKQKTREKME